MIFSRIKNLFAPLCFLLVVSSLIPYTECAKKLTAAEKAEAATIEEVSAKQLERLLEEKDYVAVYWCKCVRIKDSDGKK